METNEQEQFVNRPRLVVDAEAHQKKKEERDREEELDCLRREIAKLKENTLKNEEYHNYKSLTEGGSELGGVNPEELEVTDLEVYEKLKNFVKNKLSFDELAGEISYHRIEVSKDLIKKHEESGEQMNLPDFARTQSRPQFMAWLANKAIGEQAKRVHGKRNKEKLH